MPHRNLPKYSRYKDLLLLFAIPAGVAAFAFAVVYVPRSLARPGYDFVYSDCGYYTACSAEFVVDSSGRVVAQTTQAEYREPARLKYYSVADDASRTISLAEAQRYRLLSSSKSPDGYTLLREEKSSGFLLWGDYESSWTLKNGLKRKQVSLDDSSYRQDINFVGWVAK